MGIRSILSAHQTNLKTAVPDDRDDRIFLDFEQLEYPDLGTGSAQYTLAREENLIDRGNCELGIAPMITPETVPFLFNATWAKSTDFSHTGDASYKFTKAIAAGTSGVAYLTDSPSGGDMHGLVAGATYTWSVWVYIPTASGILGSEVLIRFIETEGNSAAAAENIYDKWQELTITRTLASTSTYAHIRFDALADAEDLEYYYIDDINLTTHNIPGTHYLSSGYVETLNELPDKFTLQIKFKPNFAFDTGVNQGIIEWPLSATQFFRFFYGQASDVFNASWKDGGTVRYIISAQYDNGTSHRNVNQYITATMAIDTTTGTTAGSSLWMNKTQDDISWNGAIDAKTSVFNKMDIGRSESLASTGDFDIAYVLMIPDVVATDAQVQNDFKDIEAQQILWTLNGHGMGRTRCNVTRFAIDGFSTERHKTDPFNGRFSANKLYFALNNSITGAEGAFSDDQYAAYVPASYQYNGTTAQKFLTNRCGVILESWYSGDFDWVFTGRVQGFPRSSTTDSYSTLAMVAEDGVADMAKDFEEQGRYWEDHKLVNQNLIDRHGCESATVPAMYNEESITASNALFVRSTAQVYQGRYSYLFTVNGAADTWVDLQDALATDDMHGLVAGSTYKFKARVYIPAGAMTGTEMLLAIGDYHGAAWSEDTQAAVAIYDAWQYVEVTSTLNAAATGIYIRIQAADAAVATETFYVDEIELICTSDASEHEDISLLHKIGHRGDRKWKQYLANNSFENATIGNSWLVTGGTLTRDITVPFIGAASAKFEPGAANEQFYQEVQFTGTKKLNVGETYNFSVFLKSTAAATAVENYISIRERDSVGLNDNTSQAYDLVGGEGDVKVEVSHTITDSDSDRLWVVVGADAGDTVFADGTQLIQNDRALNFFSVNTADGAAGIESAEDAVEITWPWMGYDVTNIDYLHGWRRMDRNTTVWQGLQSLGLASGARKWAMTGCGTLRARGYLDDGFTDPVPSVALDGSTVLRGMAVTLSMLSANLVLGHGYKINKSVLLQTLYMGTASDSFTENTSGTALNESIAIGARWPNTTTFPEYWGRIGTYEDRRPEEVELADDRIKYVPQSAEELTLFESILLAEGVIFDGPSAADAAASAANPQTIGLTPIIVGPVTHINRAHVDWSLDARGWYAPGGSDKQVIGAQEVDIIHKIRDIGDGQSTLTEVTEGKVVDGVDATSRASELRPLLQNDTGDVVILTEFGMTGKPVWQFGGSSGYVHDSFIDTQDIAKNGQKKFEFGNRDVIDQDQLNALADFYWKSCRGGKHAYGVAVEGLWHWLEPGDRITMRIGAAGKAENVDSVVEIAEIRSVYRRGAAPMSIIRVEEVEENWKYDSNAYARFVAGGLSTLKPVTNAIAVVRSEYDSLPGDYRIAIGDTSTGTVINQAITDVSGAFGGGTVMLGKGTFKFDGDISILENVTLQGHGPQTILQSESGASLKVVGGSGTEVCNTGIKDLKVMRKSGDTTAVNLVSLVYADNFTISNVWIYDSYDVGIFIGNTDGGAINNLKITDWQDTAMSFNGSNGSNCTDIFIDGGSTTGQITAITKSGSSCNFENLTIQNCERAGGILLVDTGSNENYNNVKISNITVTTSANLRGIIVDGEKNTFTGIVITNVDNTDTAANCIALYITGDDNTLSGVEVDGCSGYGIVIEGADATQISSGRSTNNGTNFLDGGTLSTCSVEDT